MTDLCDHSEIGNVPDEYEPPKEFFEPICVLFVLECENDSRTTTQIQVPVKFETRELFALHESIDFEKLEEMFDEQAEKTLGEGWWSFDSHIERRFIEDGDDCVFVADDR